MRIRRATALSLTVLVGAATLLAGDTSTGSGDGYTEAVEAFRSGDYASAAAGFQTLVDESPAWGPGYVVLGQCFYMLGKPDVADANIRSALELEPETDMFGAFFGAAQLLYGAERFDEAAAPLARALEYAPAARSAATSLQLAYALLRAERFDEARAALERHHETHGAGADSRYFLGLVCQRLGDYPCALEGLRTSGKPSAIPRLARWSHYWALLAENRERRDALLVQALADTGAWLEQEPDDGEALRYHAETLLAAGRVRETIDLLTPHAEGGTSDCTPHLLLARSFNSLDAGELAGSWATRAIACDPQLAGAHVELAAARIRRLRPEHSNLEEVRVDEAQVREAIDSLERALALDAEQHARVDSLLVDARATLKRLDQVETEFQAIDQRFADDVLVARLEEIEQRCLGILWNRRDEGHQLSAEDEAFYREQDCKRFAGNGTAGGAGDPPGRRDGSH